MSHSSLLVIGVSNDDELEAALAPFDENTEVEPYIEATREQQIAGKRASINLAEENYQKLINAEPPYNTVVRNKLHLAWITRGAYDQSKLSDDELWEVIKEDWNERDEDGNIWSTYNPKSKWDWYSVGGRWYNGLFNKLTREESNYIDRLTDLDTSISSATFAVLTPDGEWHERGDMGWWGMVADEKPAEDWNSEWLELVRKYWDQPAVLVDVHI